MDEDYQGPLCCYCAGWGNCYVCCIDDFGFIRDEFLDQNGNYFKYKKFILEKYNPEDITLLISLDKHGDGDFYIHGTHEHFKLSIVNDKVIMTPGYNPPLLQELSAKVIKKNKIPHEFLPKILQRYIMSL